MVSHVYPEEAQRIAEFDVPSDITVEGLRAALDDRLCGMGDGQVLILTDVFGSTHCNAVRQLAVLPRIRAVAGVNVPMLWRLVSPLYRSMSLDELVQRAIDGAQQGIMRVASTPVQIQGQQADPNEQAYGKDQQ